MKYSYNDFVAKWHDRFLPNSVFKIEEADFQEFALDIADTFGVSVANVPEYVPGTTYAVGYLVRYTPAGGQEGFYYAKNPGKLTAPGPSNVTDWKVVPGPVLPTELSQQISLVFAQGLDGTSVVAGRTYLVEFGPDAQGNMQTIALRGVSNDKFDVQGTLEVNGVRTAVTNVDVQVGTWQVAGVDGYTKAQADALLATKQGAIVQQVYQGWPLNSTILNLTSSSFNQYLRLDAQANSTVNLPTPAAADVGKSLVLWHYGRSANLQLLVQAKYTNGIKPVDAAFTPVVPVLPFNYVAELTVLLTSRGTPYNDVVPSYAVTSLSLLDTNILATKQYVTDALQGVSGASTFAQLTGDPNDNADLQAALAGKADLDPVTGYVLASQLPPDRIRLAFSFPAGQTTTKLLTIAFADQPGQYQIEQVSNVSSSSIYLNNTLVIIANQLVVLGDELSIMATVPAGSTGGYIYLRKI